MRSVHNLFNILEQKKGSLALFLFHKEKLSKNRYFTVRLTVKEGGGWGSAPSALKVSKCENFDPLLDALASLDFTQ